MKNEELKKYYGAKFSGAENAREFIDMVETERYHYYAVYDELPDNATDEQYDAINKIIENIEDNSYYKGIEFNLLYSFVKSTKFRILDVFSITPIKRGYVDTLKQILWDEYMGYDDNPIDEQDKLYREKQMEDYENIKTLKAFRKFIKDYELDDGEFQIWKGYFVSCLIDY